MMIHYLLALRLYPFMHVLHYTALETTLHVKQWLTYEQLASQTEELVFRIK